ncbi:VWA domain-containing protein [Guyparkeria hydrothermalis]|uniref:VWA domain-containing protein n=1 Tax=Guyparkeria hydrothermalis TaxID=923 RepID=UPI002020E61B|nr:VWA domain-containing protein [Guyparkeria hydrothermalis]MCL7744891.1 VWA domain-containing protein [Guyparkeria hydrothermalis]
MGEQVDSLIALWRLLVNAGTWPVLAHPEAFALLALPIALAFWQRRRRARLDRYADPGLRPWAFAEGQFTGGRSAWFGRTLWLLFWLFATLALADPRLPEPGETRGEVRAPVLFMVDGSAAMTGRDVEPDRVGRAVLLMELLAEADPGRPMGLMRYSDTAGVLLPISPDPELLDFYADELPGLTGTRLAARPDRAFDLAARMNALEGGAVVWITSGDARQFAGEQGSRVLAAAERLGQRDIPVFAIAMGRETTGLYREGQPLRDDDHNVLTSTPQFERVAEIAELTGGAARQTGVLREDADALADRMAALPAPPVPESALERQQSIAVLALWVAMVALALQLWFEWGAAARRQTWLAVALILVAPLLFTAAHAGPVVDATEQETLLEEAWVAFEAGEFARAQAAFDRASGYAARLGSGLTAYRRADYPHAIDRLQSAVWLAESPEPRMLALFNLGNAFVLVGRYRAAVSAFDAVLALDPQHDPALRNRQLAASLIEAAREGPSEEQPGFRGFDAMRPDPIDETQGARMSEEFLESQGGGSGPVASGSTDSGEVFRLNEGLLQGARKKLEHIEDRPRPAIEGLLRQQPYKSVVEQRLSGEDGS